MSSKPGSVDKARVEALKSWLLQYQDLESDIDHQIERVEALRAKAESASTSRWDDMPRGGGFAGDRLGRSVARIDALERETREMVQEARRLYDEREAAIDRLKQTRLRRRSDLCAVLSLRYLDGSSWPEIAEQLFGHLDDFDDRRDSYLRRVHRLHGEALAELVEILNVDELQEGEYQK